MNSKSRRRREEKRRKKKTQETAARFNSKRPIFPMHPQKTTKKDLKKKKKTRREEWKKVRHTQEENRIISFGSKVNLYTLMFFAYSRSSSKSLPRIKL